MTKYYPILGLFLSLLLTTQLVACGQAGPLYLPTQSAKHTGQ